MEMRCCFPLYLAVHFSMLIITHLHNSLHVPSPVSLYNLRISSTIIFVSVSSVGNRCPTSNSTKLTCPLSQNSSYNLLPSSLHGSSFPKTTTLGTVIRVLFSSSLNPDTNGGDIPINKIPNLNPS